MKNNYFLMLLALVFLLFGCREELDYINNENPNQNSYQLTKDNVKTQILHKQDYETRTFLKPNVNRVENFLNTSYGGSSSASKSMETDNDYEIYTDTFEEVSYRDAKYSSFYIISDRKDGYEEKLVLKSINNQVTEKYILKYKRLSDYSIDPTTYVTLKLEEKPSNDGSSLMINMEIFKMGCTTYAVTSYDCGEGGHHNGMTCPTSGEWVPFNTVTATFDPNCISDNNTGAGPGVPGGSPNTGGGSNGNVPGGNTPPVITLPTTAPLYIIQRPRGVICNPLDLNSEEISQINNDYNLRFKIYIYLAILGYSPSVCNDLPIDTEAQNFVKFTLSFFKDNPDTTWSQFENWFINSNGHANLEFDNSVDANNSINFNNLHDFKTALLNKNSFSLEYSVLQDNGSEKIVSARVKRTGIWGSGEEVRVKLKKINNIWTFDSVTSSELGLTLGVWTFTQIDYTQNTNANVLTVEVTGYENYNVFLEGLGTVYKDKVMIRVKINNTTGNIFNIEFIDL